MYGIMYTNTRDSGSNTQTLLVSMMSMDVGYASTQKDYSALECGRPN